MLWHGVSENKKAGNFARSVLLHPVQRCYKFPIPHHPSSSNLIPFISQTPYIYLTGFHNLVVKLLNVLSYGYEARGRGHYFVTSGYGFWGIPLRLGSQSEVVVIDVSGE